MDAFKYLDVIEEIAKELAAEDSAAKRARTYASIRTLIGDLEEEAEEMDGNGYTLWKIGELQWFAQQLAGLGDEPPAPDKHLAAVNAAIAKLRSASCFGKERQSARSKVTPIRSPKRDGD